jgi:hypothetical protein
MSVKIKKPLIGILAFILVLFTMPLGHTVMILIEKIGHEYMYWGAMGLGFLGVLFLLISTKYEGNENAQTYLGLFAGLFIWTGFIEFSFVYIAETLHVAPLMENGEEVRKPEYLIMPSSIGLLIAGTLYFFLDSQTRCNFFMTLKKWTGLNLPLGKVDKKKNFANTTAIETVFVIWMFYIVLLVVYDDKIAGDRHWATYAVMFGSLIWSIYLMSKLIKFNRMAPAIRYAVPTVVVFWNVVEILGRWDFFKEVWVMPSEYIMEVILITIGFAIAMLLAIYLPQPSKTKALG